MYTRMEQLLKGIGLTTREMEKGNSGLWMGAAFRESFPKISIKEKGSIISKWTRPNKNPIQREKVPNKRKCGKWWQSLSLPR